MLKKDSGAHFTYNLGVSLIRFSLLFVLWAAVIFAEWYFLSSPKFIKIDTVDLKISNFKHLSEHLNMVFLDVVGSDGSVYKHTQYATIGFMEDHRRTPMITVEDCSVYKLVGRGAESGKDYGIYITDLSRPLAEWQYYRATPGARPPVQTWGIWVSLIVSGILFMIGKRQIRLSMKYPRSDVPLDIAGAPVFSGGMSWEHYPDLAKAAVERDMRAAADLKLLTDENDGGGLDDDEETVP